jgi:hypothetical protein
MHCIVSITKYILANIQTGVEKIMLGCVSCIGMNLWSQKQVGPLVPVAYRTNYTSFLPCSVLVLLHLF